MRRFLRPLSLAGLAWAVLAWASAAAAEDLPVRLLSPRAGEALTAGAAAEVAWEPLAAFHRLPQAEEWEAFLSLDGGKTYPVRITPHLDQDLRRSRFQVPPLPAEDVRILLRFGDERRETVVELPQHFSIVASPVPEGTFAPTSPSPARGEAARPGEEGVVAWVEGSRRGGSLRQRIAVLPPGLHGWFEPAAPASQSAVLNAGRPAPEPVRHGVDLPREISRRASLGDPGTAPLLASDILLLIQRQNE